LGNIFEDDMHCHTFQAKNDLRTSLKNFMPGNETRTAHLFPVPAGPACNRRLPVLRDMAPRTPWP
jgi:hypothetical protein